MPLIRMTTRRWMIAVAVVGTLLAIGLALYRRSMRFQALADHHAHYVDLSKAIFSTRTSATDSDGNPVPIKVRHIVDGVPFDRARADWHLSLRDKYRAAAHHPWLPVPPDPPEPK